MDDGGSCTPCEPGTFSNVKGATSNATCEACGENEYTSVWGSSSCLKCQSGMCNTSTGNTGCWDKTGKCSRDSSGTNCMSNQDAECLAKGTESSCKDHSCLACPTCFGAKPVCKWSEDGGTCPPNPDKSVGGGGGIIAGGSSLRPPIAPSSTKPHRVACGGANYGYCNNGLRCARAQHGGITPNWTCI